MRFVKKATKSDFPVMYECELCNILEMGIFEPKRKCPECGYYFTYNEMTGDESNGRTSDDRK